MPRWLYPVLLVLVGTVAFSWYLVQFPMEREPYGYPLDDGWIHATFARNLAMDQEFSFNPGEASTGTTSFLWTFVLAFFYRVTGDALPASILPGIAACFFFILSLYIFSIRIFRSRNGAFLLTLMALLSGFVLWWSLSGMETILFMALAISALNTYAGKRYVAAGLLVALTTLTRPEGVALAILLIMHRIITGWGGLRRAPGPHLRFALLSLSGAGIYLFWNLLVTGHFVTSTLAGRRWLASAPIAYPIDPLYYLQKSWMLLVRWLRLITFSYVPQELPGSIAAGLLAGIVLIAMMGYLIHRLPWKRLFSGIAYGSCILSFSTLCIPEQTIDRWISENRPQQVSGISHVLINTFESSGTGLSGKRIRILSSFLGGLLLCAGVSIWLIRHSRGNGRERGMGRSSPFRLFLVWLFLHNILYVIVIPYPGHGGRYQSINVILLLFLFTEGLRRLRTLLPLGAFRRKARLAFLLILVLATGWIGAYTIPHWRVVYFSTVRHINTIHRQSAEWIARYTPEGARVAAFDIGALGYFSNRYVIDLGGLIRPDPVPFMASGNIDPYILRAGATHLSMMYLFDEETEGSTIARKLGLGRSGRYETRPLYIARFDSLEWRRNVSVAGNAYPILEISEIRPFRHRR